MFLFLPNFAFEEDIIEAAKFGGADRVKSLLDKNPELVKKTDDGLQATALHWAAMYGRKDVVAVILAHNPDVNVEEAHRGTTMHWAAHFDDSEVIAWLLDRGAKIDHKNRYGRTPLLVAARRGCRDVAEILIERGADITATVQNGSTALHITARNGHKDVIELLLAKGADGSIKNDRGQTYKDILFSRPDTIQIDPKIYDSYAGLYEREDGRTLDIRRENNSLYYFAYGKDELLPITESHFITSAEVKYFSFVRNEKGEVTEVIYKAGNLEYRATKKSQLSKQQ